MSLFRPFGTGQIIFFIKSYFYFIIHVLYWISLLIFDDQLFIRKFGNDFVQAGLDVAEVNRGGLIRFNGTLTFLGHRVLFEVEFVLCF